MSTQWYSLAKQEILCKYCKQKCGKCRPPSPPLSVLESFRHTGFLKSYLGGGDASITPQPWVWSPPALCGLELPSQLLGNSYAETANAVWRRLWIHSDSLIPLAAAWCHSGFRNHSATGNCWEPASSSVSFLWFQRQVIVLKKVIWRVPWRVRLECVQWVTFQVLCVLTLRCYYQH